MTVLKQDGGGVLALDMYRGAGGAPGGGRVMSGGACMLGEVEAEDA